MSLQKKFRLKGREPRKASVNFRIPQTTLDSFDKLKKFYRAKSRTHLFESLVEWVTQEQEKRIS